MVVALALAFVIAADSPAAATPAAEAPAPAAEPTPAAKEPAAAAAEPTAAPDEPAPVEAVTPAPAPAAPANPAAKRAGMIIGFTGGAVAVAGIVCRLLAGSAYDRIDIGYPAFNTYSELQAVRRTGELEQNLAFGLLAGGVALIAVGAILSFFVGSGS